MSPPPASRPRDRPPFTGLGGPTLVAFAELAWLIALGALFLYVGEGKSHEEAKQKALAAELKTKAADARAQGAKERAERAELAAGATSTSLEEADRAQALLRDTLTSSADQYQPVHSAALGRPARDGATTATLPADLAALARDATAERGVALRRETFVQDLLTASAAQYPLLSSAALGRPARDGATTATLPADLAALARDAAAERARLLDLTRSAQDTSATADALRAAAVGAAAELDAALRREAEVRDILTSAAAAYPGLAAAAGHPASSAATTATLPADLAALAAAVRADRIRAAGIAQEVLGLRAESFDRVALVVDVSGSMRNSPSYDIAQDVVDKWLTHLPIRSCRLVTFNDTVSVYPADGSLAMLRDNKGSTLPGALEALRAALAAAPVRGDTNTPAALRKAYEARPDAILLFTDGNPDIKGRTFASITEEVYALVRAHPNIPVNTVGLGDIGKTDQLVPFLREVARLSHGVFIGR